MENEIAIKNRVNLKLREKMISNFYKNIVLTKRKNPIVYFLFIVPRQVIFFLHIFF